MAEVTKYQYFCRSGVKTRANKEEEENHPAKAKPRPREKKIIFCSPSSAMAKMTFFAGGASISDLGEKLGRRRRKKMDEQGGHQTYPDSSSVGSGPSNGRFVAGNFWRN